MSNLKHCLLLILLLVANWPLYGQKQYRFTRLNSTQGLSNNQVTSVLKDQRGFIWIGTMSGLNRFDGCSCKIFYNDAQDSSSLNDNYIIGIFEDQNGFIWVNTRNGYNIYDPHKECFIRNAISYFKSFGINETTINAQFVDHNGNLWVSGNLTGLYKFNSKTKVTTVTNHINSDTTSIFSNTIVSIAEDSKGFIWTINSYGVLEKINPDNLHVISRHYGIYNLLKGKIIGANLFIDKDDDVWVSVTSEELGVFYYNSRLAVMEHYTKNSPVFKLSSDIVTHVIQDNAGLIWVGTDHGGITLLDKRPKTASYLLNDPNDNRSLSQNTISAFYKDKSNIIWIGTFKQGVNYYHEHIVKFKLFKHNPNDNQSVVSDDINCFAEDDKGNIYIGTNGGGLDYFNRSTGKFIHYKSGVGGLSKNVIVSLLFDREKKLWIGTYYGGLDCFDGKTFKQYRHNSTDPSSLADDRIWNIFEDSRNYLWIATLGGGLDRFDRKTGKFRHYTINEQNSVKSNFVLSITEDKTGNMWFGTSVGLDCLDPSGRFTHFENTPRKANSLSNNNVNVVFVDSRNQLWAGTREGLNLFDYKTNTFRVFRVEDGLPSNFVLTLVEDKKGTLWAGTPNGLANITINKRAGNSKIVYAIKSYDENDGLQGREFNVGAAKSLSSGELIFGGANGFNLFNPSTFRIDTKPPAIVFTGLSIFDHSVKINEKFDGRIILTKSLTETSKIVLKYNENVFSIDFAAIGQFHSEKSRYIYTLEGFNKGWFTSDSRNRRVTYTNLSPGKYILRVKASNGDGYWNEEGNSLIIIILPPLWRTWYAYLFYILILGGFLLYLRYQMLTRARLRYIAEQEHLEAQRVQELDMLKTRFFTNISHEFRTPLTLILTPLEKLIKSTSNSELSSQLSLIHRNARRLLYLVNQLLDFRKMEVQGIKLNPSFGEMVQFVKDLSFSFSDLSEKKNIHFSFNSNVKELHTWFDHDKLEKIIFNLLSNAYKFTPEDGQIVVDFIAHAIYLSDTEKRVTEVEIKVSDTGIGIPEDKQERIFENFFQNQVPGSMLNQGSGIGLSLVKEFVKLHNGTVTVESKPGKGSCFTVILPVGEKPEVVFENGEGIPSAIDNELQNTEQIADIETETSSKSKRPCLLIVEDNDDFRFYLKDNLKDRYHIVEASNGKQGLKQAFSQLPDLIVSDVMMPVMDGLAMCTELKKDVRTSHIPVILLTARNTQEQKLEGYNTGADDYLTKPFNFEILEARIKNLILLRKAMNKNFNKRLEVSPSEVKIVSQDEKLVRKAIDLVEKNIANPDFSVEELSREMGMSRVLLYKKLLSLTGKTPIEFIRTLRLKRAAQLLEKSQLSVAEVAYQVGFNNPKYFARYFKTEFNIYPSEYKGNSKTKI
jgi:signal transduction histidine kinase/ligand-binding sensor domain-containing protein/DNA-binding response OmpR family regulator